MTKQQVIEALKNYADGTHKTLAIETARKAAELLSSTYDTPEPIRVRVLEICGGNAGLAREAMKFIEGGANS